MTFFLIVVRRVVAGNMVTHRLGLSEAARGFRIVAEAAESIKVLLDNRL
jgi:threonine dehydrogenase-like Zn-dependent dehydrogenase